MASPLLVAKTGKTELHLLPALANRHGLITGATGTGKTVTLQTLAEQFSRAGVPVFMADVKGDLSGMAKAGGGNPKVAERAKLLGLGLKHEPCPVVFWDVFGAAGHPVRATISDMGPLLIARLLALNDTQEGVLNLVFKIADDAGLLLLDAKDLRTMLQHVGDNAAQFTTAYGNVSAASVGAIQRGLLALESQGADRFFGEPMLNIADLMQAQGGKGVVNILAADKLMNSPKLYSTFLLWMLAELFEQLPEVGDPEKPKLVFFFDEAHLLFDEAPKALLEKIEQVITELGVGEALVSLLDEKGRPSVTERAFVVPPGSQLGPLTEAERKTAICASSVAGHYEKQVDRESAYEKLKARAEQVAQEKAQQEQPKQGSLASDILFGKTGPRGGKQSQGLIEAMAKSAARTVGSQVGRELIRGVLGSLLGKRR